MALVSEAGPLLLLVAAAREELGELPGHTLGVGAVVAAVSMGRLIHRFSPSGVVLIGTGGAYAGGPAIGQARRARRIGLADGSAAMGLGYTPRPPSPIVCDARLGARIQVPEVDVLTVGAVTTDRVLADRLSDGWQVEHIEAYGAALACEALGVPFAAVVGISNRAGREAHAQWLTHCTEARAAAREAVAPLFESAAPNS